MVTQQLAAFVVAPLSGTDALDMMRLSLMDWAACGIAGCDEPVSRITRDMVLAEGGQGASCVFGGGFAPARGAALVNGATSHALDYDDTHFAHIGHPSVAVVPAALAVAQSQDRSGADFVKACLLGAELSIRVGMWLGRGHYQTGFHQTATAGAFGAAAACGRLLGLNADQMAQALGLVATRAAGLKSQFGTMGKPYNAGIAASAGVEAALLVLNGFVSSPIALEGAQGFGPTHAGQNDLTALDGLGTIWQFENISHKFHACCHGLHAMLEAINSLDVLTDDIEAVEITTHPRWMTVCNQLEPKTGLEAKFSYRLTAAMTLAGLKTSAMDSYTDAMTQDPKVIALRDKVSVVVDDAIVETASHVRVRVGNTWHEATHDLNAPMDIKDRAKKLRSKAAALVGQEKAERLWTATQSDNIMALTQEMG